MRLYDYLPSGNAYKARLLLAQLGTPYERIDVDILEGESRTPEFLARNPNGRVPVLEADDGRCLAESGAILWHLAEGTRFLPADSWARAEVLQWMFFEQYSHEPFIAVVRHWITELGRGESHKDEIAEKRERGYAALDIMEGRLADHDFLIDGNYTIADIALYAYTHVAAEGGFDLARYGAIRDWMDRVRRQPNHVPITRA